MEEDLLYGDLESANLVIDLEKLTDKCLALEKKLISLEQELVNCRNQNSQITVEKEQLEKNMVTLFNTALLEISRKDKELVELRLQLAKRNP